MSTGAAGWTCFHCAEYFPATVEGRAAAREHFGPAHYATIAAHAAGDRQSLQLLAELLDRQLARANVSTLGDLVEQLETLRSRLQAADAFSRVVFRLRPTVWSVAMVDAYGPGDHAPPAELGFPPGAIETSVELVLDQAASTSMREALGAFLARRPGT